MKKQSLPLLLLAILLLFGCGKTNTVVEAPDDAAAPEASVSAASSNESAASEMGQLDFTTTDINDNPFSVDDLKNAGLIDMLYSSAVWRSSMKNTRIRAF